MTLLANSRINGRYEVVGAAGAGAQGDVLRIRDGGGELVLKAVGVASSPEAGRALIREFAHLARLEDPALPRVHDLGVAESGPLPVGTVFFTAERIDGVPLLRALAAAGAGSPRGRMPERLDAGATPASAENDRARLLWSIARDLAGALATLHAAGVLHHDVTPANVLVVGAGVDARAVLIDLGLATAGRSAIARGTPAYLAPEALAGGAEPRSDLWSLGATLHHAATGAPPFGDGELGAVVRAILERSPPPLTGLPPPLAAVLARLLARRPEERWASAVALARALDDVAAAVTPPVRPRAPIAVGATVAPPALVGAGRAIAAIAAALDDAGPPRWVHGRHGARVAEVIDAAVRAHQLARASHGVAPAAIVRGRIDDVARRLDAPDLRRLAAALAHPGPAVILDVTGDDRADELARLLAAAPVARPVVVGQERDAAMAPRGLAAIELAPVTLDELATLASELLGRVPPRRWLVSLHEVSGGLPGLAAEVVRIAAASGDPFAIAPAKLARDAAAIAHAAAARLGELEPSTRDAARAVALWEEGRAPATVVLGLAGPEAIGRAIAAGAIARDGDTLVMPARVAEAVRGQIADAAALHARTVAAGRAAGLDDVALATHLAGASDPAATAACAAAAELALARGRLGPARTLAQVAARTGDPRGLALLARAETGLGAYPAARTAALAAAEASQGDERARARLLAARAAQRAGDLDLAERELADLARDLSSAAAGSPRGRMPERLAAGSPRGRMPERLAAGVTPAAAELAPAAAGSPRGRMPERLAAGVTPATAELEKEVAGVRARLLVSRGRHDEALAIAGEIRGDGAGARLCLEAAGLAAFYTGDLDGAAARFARLGALAADDPALAGRAAALAAMVALQRGNLAGASALQRQAGDAARAAGDFHAAAVADLNLATALAERGHHGEALPVLARAIAALDALGAHGERAAAEFNRGNALLAVGDVEGAAAAAERAQGGAGGDVAIYARLLLGDVARRRGDLAAARAAYQGALAAAPGGHARLCALCALAEIAPRAEVDALAAEAAALASSADDRARIAALRAPSDPHAAAAAGRAALAAGRADRAWRTLTAAAEASPGPLGAAFAREAAEIRAGLVAATPEAWRAGLDDDPDARRLGALEDSRERSFQELATPKATMQTITTEPSHEVARLRRLLALSRRLNAELVVERLLDDVIDAAIEMTEAERGFLLLRPGPGQPLEVVVARNFTAGALDDAAGKISRSIAERAATSGEPVITVDAGVDERFGAARSVAALRLRSVMAVPLRQKGRITGCIYVDHRLRDGAFDDRAAALALDLGDIAAIAIENARLAADLRRRQDENDTLNARLAAELDDKDAELTRVRATLPGRGALRGHYEAIVGESPAIAAMLSVVDRAARTELPVVVVGDSGTGKELVARALHDHGPRKDQPFVALNCSAMPEPLLESELFGHVRGAFTGADRDRRGLFEVADGGTLFLDEVADTGPAMQAKLLRVVQDGQVRRVGDERTRKVDVRIVAASQRPLAELVTAGRFREDLRYRLEVIQVLVPPLRERLEDVPALVEHMLDRIAAKIGGRPQITRAALRALGRHAWPGNVRELENAIARACALGGAVIDVEDLPETIANARWTPPASAGPTTDLSLKPALEALERSYVDAALERAGGNQTVAARLLGLSRFGLQKKLRRLGEAE